MKRKDKFCFNFPGRVFFRDYEDESDEVINIGDTRPRSFTGERALARLMIEALTYFAGTNLPGLTRVRIRIFLANKKLIHASRVLSIIDNLRFL
jgi:hypothetical protein